MLVLEHESPMPCAAETMFRWHETLPDAFQTLLPPGEPVRLLHHDGHVRDGARVSLRTGRFPFCFRWDLEHRDYVEGRQFCDVQVRGPFRHWEHRHQMIPVGEQSCLLRDRITFSLPGGALGRWVGRRWILPKLNALFQFRHQATLADLKTRGLA